MADRNRRSGPCRRRAAAARRRHRSGAWAAMVLIAAGACAAPSAATRYDAVVTRTVDGDTVKVRYRDGRTDTVRLIGVDTPETHKPGVAVQCFGPQAERYTRSVLTGRTVTLELDREPRDKYGRLLAYLIVDGTTFQRTLLLRGYGRLLVIPPNDARARSFAAAQLEARRAGRGLWSAC